MKNSLFGFLVLFACQAALALPPSPPPARTIKNLKGFPRETLRNEISRQLYRSLEVSPIEAWVVARTAIYSSHTANPKIVHSEANGVYDKMLLELASSYSTSGDNMVESRIQGDSLSVHLLIFKIKDGEMGICFGHSDDARYVGYPQSGDAWIGIRQNGEWRTVSKPRRR